MKRIVFIGVTTLLAATALAQQPASEIVNWSGGVAYTYDGSGNARQIGRDIFVYDEIGRLVMAEVNGVRRNYTYDEYGNRLGCTSTAGDCQGYSINSSDNHVASAAYDPQGSGNITGFDGHLYTYDAFNMMKSDAGGDSREFIYTAGDERIAVYSAGSRSWKWTMRDMADNPLRELASDGGALGTASFRWLKDYVWREGLLLATSQPEGASTSTYHYHLDHAGTPRRITDAGDNSVGFHDYYAFGPEAAGKNEPSFTSVKYTGHERDNAGAVTGVLDYMHARYYSPMLGRFLSVDPARAWSVELPQTWNRYAYARNNPLRFIDPDGQAEVDIHVYAAPASNYSKQDFAARLVGDPKHTPDRMSRFGNHANTYTDARTAAGDLKRSLSVKGAFVIYYGHALFQGKTAIGLDPKGQQKRGDAISTGQLTQMLKTSKASVVLITGCSSAACVTPGMKSTAGAIVAIRPTSAQGTFSSSNYTARATETFTNAMLGTTPDNNNSFTPPATVGEAIDAANQELIDTKQPYRFELIWGSESVALSADPQS